MNNFKRSELLLLAFLVLLFPGSAVAQTSSEVRANSSLAPWIGKWTIIEDRSADRTNETNLSVIVEIRRTADNKGLEIVRKIPQGPDVKEVLVPDGTRRPVDEKNCSGWQIAQLIPEAGAIISSSEMSCKDSGSFTTSNLKMILANDQMVDILGIKTAGQTRIATRRLRFEQETTSAEDSRSRMTAMMARTAAAAPWNLNTIARLSGIVDTPVLEAALLERNVRLSITAKSLRQMEADKIPKEIIDLLVALAFPNKFDIQKNGQIALRPWSGSSSAGYSSYAYTPSVGYYPGAFYNCFSPYDYGGYGYIGLLSPGSCWSYYSPFWWDYPVYFIRSGGVENNARLSAYRGYVQIKSVETGRHARPRQGFGSSGRYSGSSQVYNPTVDASSGGSSSSGGGTSSGGASSGGASASPGGYSSGSNGGGKAVPR